MTCFCFASTEYFSPKPYIVGQTRNLQVLKNISNNPIEILTCFRNPKQNKTVRTECDANGGLG